MNLQDYWNKKILPNADITFADGTTIMLKQNWCRESYKVERKSTLENPYKGNIEELVVFDILGKTVHPDTGYIAYRGEGSMGNEGFVAYSDENEQLLWLLFLDFSNPFWEIHFEGNNIIAKTESEFCFVIPIYEPEKLSCSAVNNWDLEHIQLCEEKYKNA